MSLYRKVLKQALVLSWHYKYLWFFGLFAVLIGNSGEYEVFVRGLSGDLGQGFSDSLSRLISADLFSGQALSAINDLFAQDAFSFILFIIITLVILVMVGFLIWLSVASQAALVNNSAAIISGKKNSFKDGIEKGAKVFWPVFGLNIASKVIIAILFMIIGLPIFLTAGRAGSVSASLFYLVLFVIFVPLAVSVAFLIKYAIAYVVIKDNDFFTAVKNGWRLFADNWLVSIEMALALFFINFLLGLAVILAVLILAVPLLFLSLIFYYLASFVGFWLIVTLSLFIFVVLIAVSGSAITTFQISAWTGLFIELVGRGGTSKIIRLAGKFIKN